MGMNLSLGIAGAMSRSKCKRHGTRSKTHGQNAFLALGGRCPCSQSNVSTPCAARRVDKFTEGGLEGAIKTYHYTCLSLSGQPLCCSGVYSTLTEVSR